MHHLYPHDPQRPQKDDMQNNLVDQGLSDPFWKRPKKVLLDSWAARASLDPPRRVTLWKLRLPGQVLAVLVGVTCPGQGKALTLPTRWHLETRRSPCHLWEAQIAVHHLSLTQGLEVFGGGMGGWSNGSRERK